MSYLLPSYIFKSKLNLLINPDGVILGLDENFKSFISFFKDIGIIVFIITFRNNFIITGGLILVFLKIRN